MRQLFGWILIVVGGLWLLLAGGCTFYFLSAELAPIIHGNGPGQGPSLLPTILVFGVVGIAPALLILWGGLALRKWGAAHHRAHAAVEAPPPADAL